jgi:hypothetical protein
MQRINHPSDAAISQGWFGGVEFEKSGIYRSFAFLSHRQKEYLDLCQYVSGE